LAEVLSDPAGETIEMRYSSGTLIIRGMHLRPLLTALQKYTVEILRSVAERYHAAGSHAMSLEYSPSSNL
jgi:hypothetical protein